MSENAEIMLLNRMRAGPALHGALGRSSRYQFQRPINKE